MLSCIHAAPLVYLAFKCSGLSQSLCGLFLVYSSCLPTKLFCLKLSVCHVMTASVSKNSTTNC